MMRPSIIGTGGTASPILLIILTLALLNRLNIPQRPVEQYRERPLQGFAKRRQRILDAKHPPVQHFAMYHAVAFQFAQGLGQHALRDAIQTALDGVEALRLAQHFQHHHGPFIGNLIEHDAARAVGAVNNIGLIHRYLPASLGCLRCVIDARYAKYTIRHRARITRTCTPGKRTLR